MGPGELAKLGLLVNDLIPVEMKLGGAKQLETLFMMIFTPLSYQLGKPSQCFSHSRDEVTKQAARNDIH